MFPGGSLTDWGVGGETQTTPSLVSLRTDVPRLAWLKEIVTLDIAGANLAQWNSVLVHTGVYDPQHRSSLPGSKTPTFEAKDVEEAVRLVINEEMKFAR